MRVSGKVRVVLALSVSLAALGCKPQSIRHTERTDPFFIIADRQTTPTDLEAAIGKLYMPPIEPPEYWSRMANDSGYSTFHRRRAVMQLFKRHLRVKMQLSDLARLLDHPTWTRENDITEVTIVAGWIPVDTNFNDTVFVLTILRDPGKDAGVWLRVRGKVDLQSFKDLVLQNKTASIGNVTIAEIGLMEQYSGRTTRFSGMRESGKCWEYEEHF